MKKVAITATYKKNYTNIPNFFIDHYLSSANGDFVKVYIWLIKEADQGYEAISIENIADIFNLTEADIIRAIKYWHKMKVIEASWENKELRSIEILDNPRTSNATPISNTSNVSVNDIDYNQHESDDYRDDNLQVSDIDATTENEIEPSTKDTRTPRAIQSKPTYTTSELVAFKKQVEYSQLVYITERYLGKNLTESDLRTLFSLHDWIGLPFEVIEILIEYCVTNNHRNLRYIEKVALDWSDNDINTVDKATYRTQTTSKQYFMIFKALGIPNRNPVQFEIDMMNNWLNLFDVEIILEACDRTIKQTNTGSLKYADKILMEWSKNNVKRFSDIEALDQSYISNKATAKKAATTLSSSNKKTNKFSNYNQRDYDFDDLEKKAIAMRLKETQKGS